MTSEEIKAALLELHEPKVDFELEVTGRANKRSNGLYFPARHAIKLYDKNFTADNPLFWTAMHEYAHHIMVTEKGATGSRSHTNAFWAVVHELAAIAESKGLYQRAAAAESMAEVDKTLTDLLKQSGEILKAIGRALIEAKKTCDKSGVRFEDYVMRDLKQSMPWATMCMQAAGYDLPAELGAENIKTVAAIKNGDERAATIEALEGDLSPQQVKAAKAAANKPADVVQRLEEERKRLARTISHLTNRLDEVESALASARDGGTS
jgi:chaperonin cofactor prefoldin